MARDRASQALLGFISVWCRPRPFIDHLHCDPSNTGRGIGGLLLRESFYHLDKNGYQDVYLTVLVGNDRARRFYLRKGAEPDKVSREWIFQYPVDVETLKWTNIGNQL
ncbi:GNAT family N-acetyltransferase [uncultured Cohaesibacter sp.]|uniref:GNAT family N-acetyltransferase n=1 Tax=uncultured Cohaesibacter sp. TaxID=1002546 RepID=UPI003747EE9D